MLHGFARLHCQLKSAKVFLITVFCISFYLCKNGAVCHHWFTNKTNIYYYIGCSHAHIRITTGEEGSASPSLLICSNLASSVRGISQGRLSFVV